ncbi:MAG: pentapeptide repeat-containing protein [Geminicoccaceae bacterium]
MTSQLRKVEQEPEEESARGREARAASAEPQPNTELWRPDLPARIDKLQAAASTASAHARNVYVTFLLFGLYLAIIFGSTTHEQLLRESPVTLPLLNVGLPLVGFYWVAPALLVLLHLNLLIQLYLLSQKLHRLDRAIRLVGDVEQADEQRAQLYPFTFSQMLIGWQREALMRSLIWLMVWLTVFVLPVVLLLAGQVRFLPYHDAWTTMWHRFLVAADVLLVLNFWRPIRHPKDRPLTYPLRWLWHQMKVLPLTLGALALSILVFTFPGDPETLDPGSDLAPAKAVSGLWQEEKDDFGDPMDEWLLAVAPESLVARGGGHPILRPTRYLFSRLPFLQRNLVVQETNLVVSWPTRAQIDQHGEDLAWQNFGAPPILSGRDLRYADLTRSILVRGNFDEANLQGASLWGANLQGAFLLNANLQSARLNDANLQGALLAGAKLQGADLSAANLQGATLWNVNLQGADFAVANLQGVSLWGGNLQGARLIGADLQGAALANANLQGAVLWGANLQGAERGGFKFQGGVVFDADFLGTDFPSAANLPSANLQGADLRGAHLWRASLEDGGNSGDRWGLVDLRGVDVDPIEALDAWIEEVMRQIGGDEQIGGEETRGHVADVLRAALRDDDRPETPRFPDEWRSAPKAMFDPGDPLPQRLGWGARVWATDDAYDEDLAEFLGELACGQDATIYVTHGLAGRVLSDRNRLYAKELAVRLTGDDCPPATDLPQEMRAQLKELAAKLGSIQGEADVIPAEASQPFSDEG